MMTDPSSSDHTFDEVNFPLKLIFSHDSPSDCTISLGEKTLYTVQTRREVTKTKLGRAELLVTTDIFDAAKGLVASLVWNDLASDVITWRSRGLEKAKLSTWLKKSFIPFSNNASFQGAENNTYKWDTKGPRNQFRLLADKDTVIAYFEHANPYVNPEPGYNYNPFPKPSCLHLSEQADTMREDVVLSFLLLEKDRRRSDGSRERWADAQAISASYVGIMPFGGPGA